MSGPAILAHRPSAGPPRPYHFPGFRRSRLDNGLTVIAADVPGRPLMAAGLLLPGGAGHEPARLAGVSSLTARAMSEGTRRRDAVAFIEASERLGASLGASCDWEMLTLSLTVPRGRLEPALELLGEMLREPAFPAHEVDRLREQRLNELLQAAAQPGRRAERTFLGHIYDPASPYARPLGGDEETVPRLDRAELVARHESHLDPAQATLILAGDMEGLDPVAMAQAQFGSWRAAPGVPGTAPTPVPAVPAAGAHATIVVDRPGSPQSEVRIGHVGLRRRIPDYHATIVLTTMLGGLFNSRLQRLLREEKGYTYHISASFDFRRSPGPFAVRTAVQTEVTAPAVSEALGVLRRLTADAPTPAELSEASEFLIGVFPLRFESPEQVAGAIAGLVTQELPDDELDRYRPAVAAVTASDVVAAASHIRPDAAAVVLVGDAERVVPDLEAADLGPVQVVPAA